MRGYLLVEPFSRLHLRRACGCELALELVLLTCAAIGSVLFAMLALLCILGAPLYSNRARATRSATRVAGVAIRAVKRAYKAVNIYKLIK